MSVFLMSRVYENGDCVSRENDCKRWSDDNYCQLKGCMDRLNLKNKEVRMNRMNPKFFQERIGNQQLNELVLPSAIK